MKIFLNKIYTSIVDSITFNINIDTLCRLLA